MNPEADFHCIRCVQKKKDAKINGSHQHFNIGCEILRCPSAITLDSVGQPC